MSRHPLEIEALAGIDSDRLGVATQATRPLPVSIQDHRRSLAPQKPADPIDELIGELRSIQPEGHGR
jgi:hypothetical protein